MVIARIIGAIRGIAKPQSGVLSASKPLWTGINTTTSTTMVVPTKAIATPKAGYPHGGTIPPGLRLNSKRVADDSRRLAPASSRPIQPALGLNLAPAHNPGNGPG